MTLSWYGEKKLDTSLSLSEYQYMLIRMKTDRVLRFLFVLFAGLVATSEARAQALSVFVVKPHVVDLTFPSDAAVEAVV